MIVARKDLHREAMVTQGSQRRRRRLLRRIEKADESREREFRLVGQRVRAVALVEISIRHGNDAEPVLVQTGNQFLRVVGSLDSELGDEIFVMHGPTDREDLFDRALANELVMVMVLIDDNGHSPTCKIERNLVDL